MTKTATPTARDIERECAEQKRHARRGGMEADAARNVARNAFKTAERDRDLALEARVRGDDGADELLAAALEQVRDCAANIAEAEAMSSAARRVYEQADARLRQTREACIDELAADAEQLVTAAVKARDELRAGLEEYLRAYRAAERRWQELRGGAFAKVQQQDAEAGIARYRDTLMYEASCPPCPIDGDVITKLLGTTPRPPVFGVDEPTAPFVTEAEGAGYKVLFPGDPGHQPNGRTLPDSGPVPTPRGFQEVPSDRQSRARAAQQEIDRAVEAGRR